MIMIIRDTWILRQSPNLQRVSGFWGDIHRNKQVQCNHNCSDVLKICTKYYRNQEKEVVGLPGEVSHVFTSQRN